MRSSARHTDYWWTEFPFYRGVLAADCLTGLPTHLPFGLHADDIHGFPRLMLDEPIREALRRAYALGSSCSTPLGTSDLSTRRLQHFLAEVDQVLGHSLASREIVEVGCGAGHLLAHLQARGANAIGFDPGPLPAADLPRERLQIHQCEFDPQLLARPVDAVLSYGTLEHVEDVSILLRDLASVLRPGGWMIHAVPNSPVYFDQFSFDGLSHEHLNYFDAQSARALMYAHGLTDCFARPTADSNMLVLGGRKQELPSPRHGSGTGTLGDDPIQRGSSRESGQSSTVTDTTRLRVGYYDRLERYRRVMEHLLGEGTVAFYGGGFVVEDLLGLTGQVRHINGDERTWGGRYLTGCQAICSPAQLNDDPPSSIIIWPEHHYSAIANRIADLWTSSIPPRMWRASQLADSA